MIWLRVGILVGWSIATALLVLTWKRHSLERERSRRWAELYVWVLSVPLLAVGVAYATLGLVGFGVLGGLHLLALAVALRVLGRPLAGAASAARATSALLLTGPSLVLLGAITWPGGDLTSIAERPEGHAATAGLFLLGSLVTLAGFVGLRAVLCAAGDDWLSRLGLVGLEVGTAMWTIHLLVRIALVLPVARTPEEPPSWFDPMVTLSGGLYAVYMVLAYLATAAHGRALARVGLVSAGWGRGLMGFGLLAAVGFVIPGPFRPPLVVQLPVYAMGILILRKLIGEARAGSAPGKGSSPGIPV
jgi:hypothetical protein